jgi:acetolactate decarboxylase
VAVDAPLEHDQLLALIDRQAGGADASRAVRITGVMDVHGRSVPRQEPPYRPLAEVVAEQRVFDLLSLPATVVGFRFPTVAGGIEVPGYHLHAIADDRSAGGHVLRCRLHRGRVAIGRLTALHMELPPGVALPAADRAADADALHRVEHAG